ncbi:MAG: glycoside hydrolase family 3 C-terminal domain-containing protein [Acidimicrobiales bacterium]|nr:glycoside hydrolase family 3 C-terminal domain-containing protein [Acidimicrobiales bacterium]
MTLDEKLAQLGGVWLTSLVRGDRLDPDWVAERLRHGVGHVTRIGASTGLRPSASAALTNEIQRVAVERTRLGIPVVVHEESTGGFCARDATVFPQGAGLAATWDEGLVEDVAGVIRDQLVAVGARQTLAPVLDVARDPRWGRVEETYGEDPYLAGRIGTAYVRGLQTADLRGGVLATGKHFLGYGLPEGGMNHAPVHLGPRELREVYAEPFAAAIRDAGLASVMNSYSSVDGLPCAGAPEILTGLLRDELGFDGVVVADYFSVVLLLVHHRVAADPGQAAALALTAGLDLELPASNCYGDPLRAEVEAGRVPLEVVDRACGRVLASKLRLGLFERPYVDAARAAEVFDTPGQRALARRAAARSLVLLRNEGGLLPLPPTVGTIAVVGPLADDERLLQGDYHYPAHVEIVYQSGISLTSDDAPAAGAGGVAFLPEAGGAFDAGPYFTPHVTPLAGIRAALGPGTRVLHERGCDVTDPDPGGIPDAVAAAARADVAVVCVGGRSGLLPGCTVGEARDATDLGLTGAQQHLVEEVVATGTPTVVVVLSGRVHALPWVAEHVPAVIFGFPPGEEGGHALADVLFGAVDPSGRLPVSLPRSVGQVPVHHGHRAGGGRSAFHGDYVDSATTPLFPFGHGLSYASFVHTGLVAEGASTEEPVTVSVVITNTGTRAGVEVVQLYGRDDVASVARPDRLLLGFARVALDPGESRQVAFTVHPSRLAFYDPSMRFVVEPGTFTFSVARSAADVVATAVVDLAGPVVEHRQRAVVATAVEVR